MGDKWTLLIVRDLMSGPRRFVELQRVLPGISTEQLRSRLNRMVADGLLTRQRYREVPPRVDYELTERARELAPVVGALARWGLTWAWGPPRTGERVDVGAVFRCAPGLLTMPDGMRGTLELRVGERSYVLTLGAGETSLAEGPSAGASVTVSGDQDAWVRALGPSGDRSGLGVDGDVRLATAVLGALAGAAARATLAA